MVGRRARRTFWIASRRLLEEERRLAVGIRPISRACAA
jgi:hypothetical protein